MSSKSKFDLQVTWERVLADDTAAWRLLVDHFSGLIMAVARRTGLSEPDAEDCAQNCLLALYRHRKKIKDPAALPAWLIKTAHRGAVEMARRLRPAALEEYLSKPIPARLPDESIIQIEQEFLIREAVRRLDSRCRKVIEELYLRDECCSYRELAQQLKLSTNSLGSLRSRCLIKLAKILEEMGVSLD